MRVSHAPSAVVPLDIGSHPAAAGSGPGARARVGPRRELQQGILESVASGGGDAASSIGSKVTDAASNGGQYVAEKAHAAEATVAPAVHNAQSAASQVGGAVSGGARDAGAGAQRAASAAAAVPQQVTSNANAGAAHQAAGGAAGGAQNVGAEVQSALGSIAAVVKDITSKNDAGAVQQVGSDLNSAGVDTSCSDGSLGAKACNGVFGGADGANSAAADALGAATAKDPDEARTNADKAGQTVADASVQSAGEAISEAGAAVGDPNINNCQGDGVTSEACRSGQAVVRPP